MTDIDPPPEFTDVDEAVAEEWEASTTPYERVREVVSHVYDPLSADEVAERAQTSAKTARKHLENLADEGFVATEPGPNGGTRYRRSSESLVVEQAVDILSSVSVEELAARVDDMRGRIESFRSEYGVETPEALTVQRANRTLSESGTATGAESPAPSRETLREWQRTRRNLAFANAALSIANAERFVDGDAIDPDGTVSAR